MSWRFITFSGYAVVSCLVLAWQAVTVRRPNSVTLGSLFGWLMRSPTRRALVFLAWAWLGWHLFARGSAGT
jgi:hypothetical protein